MNVTGLIQRFQPASPVTLIRALAPVLDDATGVFEPTEPTESTLSPVVVHTVSGRDLAELPEASRTSETIQVYATERLFCADDGVQDADRIRYRGRTYRVAKTFDEAANGGGWFAYATLEEPAAVEET